MAWGLPLRKHMDIAYIIIYFNTMAGITYAEEPTQGGVDGEPSALMDETLSSTWQWGGSPKYAYDDIPNTLFTTAHIHTLSFRPCYSQLHRIAGHPAAIGSIRDRASIYLCLR